MTLRTTLRLMALGCLALFFGAIHLQSQLGLVASVLLGVAIAIARLRSDDATDRRRTVLAGAQSHLEPGEIVQAAFAARSGPGPYLILVVAILAFLLLLLPGGRYAAWAPPFLLALTSMWSVIATDRSILLFKQRWMSDKVFVARLPRHTRLGPLSGWWGKIRLNGRWMFVHKQFHAEVELADSLIAQREIVEQSEHAPRLGRGNKGVSLRLRDGGRRR